MNLLLYGVLLANVWPQFRGPNSAGLADDAALPTEIGPSKNLLWKVDLPAGKSSPVFAGDRIFLTGHDGDKLLTLCLDRPSGRELWRRDVARSRTERRHKLNDPAAPTPVTDGRNVYAFFADFGLVAYSGEGKELWRVPLDPMPSMQGVASSPLLHGSRLILVVDQADGSYMMALDARTGETLWKRARRPAPGGAYSTPIVFRTSKGEEQLVTFSPFELAGFSLDKGDKLWWFGGLPPQPQSTPLASGGTIFAFAKSFFGDAAPVIHPFAAVIEQVDKNKDGKIQKDEAPDGPGKQFFNIVDRNRDGALDAAEWAGMAEAAAPKSTLVAIRPDGRGDLTQTAQLWRHDKGIPNVPSPLAYRGLLYTLQNGGILTAIDPATGSIRKQGRLTGALGDFYASPVASGGHLYMANQNGQVAVVRAGADWEVVSVADLQDDCFATPAIVDGKLYVRTSRALWSFGN
jgi:outer membrane protein assembly factor BamB